MITLYYNIEKIKTNQWNKWNEEENLTYLLNNNWPYACCATQSINSCNVDESWFTCKDLQFL